MTEKGSTLDTGLPLHVQVYGSEDENETFVLLHGYGGSSFTWRHWLPMLTARGRVLAVDMKGFGKAPRSEDGRYAPRDLADLVVDALRRLDLRNVTLVGHSLGGGIALLATLRLLELGEDRIGRLVLIASPAFRQRLPPFVLLSRAPRLGALLLRILGTDRVIRSVLRSIVHDRGSVTDEQVEGYAEAFRREGSVRAAAAVGRRILPADLERTAARYPHVDVPVLVLWGREDRVVPLWVGERLATTLPHARLEILEACGHLPPEEQPEESWARVAAFLDETGAGS